MKEDEREDAGVVRKYLEDDATDVLLSATIWNGYHLC
jgi:hypothetical protein